MALRVDENDTIVFETDHPQGLELNLPLLRKVVEWAEAEAAKPDETKCGWFQDAWAVTDHEIGRQTECGTCFCIAGYAAYLTLKPGEYLHNGDEIWFDGEMITSVADRAVIELGTEGYPNGDYKEGYLFSAYNSIERVRQLAEQIAGEPL